MMEALNVYTSYDSRYEMKYRVMLASMFRNTKALVNVYPLRIGWLHELNLLKDKDHKLTHVYDIARFFTPELNDFRGWALYLDHDFFIRGDISKILDHRDNSKGAMVVRRKHDPRVPVAPRRDWSSFMYINCGHEEVRRLSAEVVNRSTDAYLHGFQWLSEAAIGELPLEYNYIDGENTPEQCAEPIAVKYHGKESRIVHEWTRYESFAPKNQ